MFSLNKNSWTHCFLYIVILILNNYMKGSNMYDNELSLCFAFTSFTKVESRFLEKEMGNQNTKVFISFSWWIQFSMNYSNRMSCYDIVIKLLSNSHGTNPTRDPRYSDPCCFTTYSLWSNDNFETSMNDAWEQQYLVSRGIVTLMSLILCSFTR